MQMNAHAKANLAEQGFANLYAGMLCTLDGERAIIGGRHNTFASVRSLESCKQCEFNWHAVNRIMTRDGAFLG